MNLAILHHLGLGDHFICNGLVREYASRYDKIALMTAHNNFETVKAMYADLPNFEPVYILTNEDAWNKVQMYSNKKDYQLLLVGGFWSQKSVPACNWTKRFYYYADLDPELRYSKFYIPRNPEREKLLAEKLQVNFNEPYIFIHDDASRGYNITKIQNNSKIIRPIRSLTENCLDYLFVLERADEIHCMDSSFMCLIEHYKPLRTKKLYMHYYTRPVPIEHRPELLGNWTFVE